MKKKSLTFYEIILAIIIIVLLLAPQLIGTTTVYDDTEGGSISMEVTYTGENRNPLEAGDDLSLLLIRHACRTLDWHYHDGVCRIEGKLFQGAFPLL